MFSYFVYTSNIHISALFFTSILNCSKIFANFYNSPNWYSSVRSSLGEYKTSFVPQFQNGFYLHKRLCEERREQWSFGCYVLFFRKGFVFFYCSLMSINLKCENRFFGAGFLLFQVLGLNSVFCSFKMQLYFSEENIKEPVLP